ncbi:MAG: precorrin-6A reductase [Phascolarctobacterium sp.]|nr:precorrin-6A reductase [Phascolarctobacterium sp.]
MKPVIWLIGGTSEGRALIKAMADLNVELFVSVATDYGAELIEPQDNLTIMAERMDFAKMRTFLQNHQPACVIDATHPYAAIVTATVQEACTCENAKYVRLLRPVGEAGDYITVHDFPEAVELLNQVEGNIFLTTGSKNLKDFTAVQDYKERIALRVLPMESSLLSALELGYKPANVVCMQGPFSKELNTAMFKKFRSKYVVTKDSGEVGGFAEKVEAANEAGAKLIVIGRVVEEQGKGFVEIVEDLRRNFAGK